MASGSVIPPEPEKWKKLVTITSSKTWKVPEDNWYRIHVIGPGGKDGDGGNTRGTQGSAKSGGGGGGGSGGYSVSIYYFKKGEALTCTISSAQTVFNGPDTMMASVGGAGSNGTSTTGGNGAGGGGSSGGNVLNTTAAGVKGGYADTRRYMGNATNLGAIYSSYYGNGGTGGIVSKLVSSTYGNGGPGGIGGYYTRDVDNGRVTPWYSVSPSGGAVGQPGAVIIEKGVTG